MIFQTLTLKRFFSWGELLSNLRMMRRARSPLRGYVTTLSFWALIDIGLLDLLSKSSEISLQEFAKNRQLNENILFYICRYLHRAGYLKIQGDRLSLTQSGRRFWNDVFGVFHLFSAYEPLFSSLSRQLMNQASFGKNLYRREDEVALGFSVLGRNFLFKIMARIVEKEGFRSIVDLGCAEAELSRFLCEGDPQMSCLGIDYSAEMIEKGNKRIEDADLKTRVRLMQADMFEIDRLTHDFSSYELVTAIDLFHGYFWEGEEKLLNLFQKLRRVFSRQRFLISEICLPPEKCMKKIAYPYMEHEFFHDLTHQKSFAPGELESLLERAGFRIRKKWNLNKIAGRICLLL